MSSSWLYTIRKAPGFNFEINGESIPVTTDSYWSLIENQRLNEDKAWNFSQLGGKLKQGDELFIYTGTNNLGIIGYAIVGSVTRLPKGWSLEPIFDYAKSHMLRDHPISARSVRSWGINLRRNVIDISFRRSELQSLLPWASHSIVQLFPEELLNHSELTEGAKQTIVVNAYERNPKARQQCLDNNDAVCIICQCDFGQRYGPEMAGFIHVHHITPLSSIGTTYFVDPIVDLKPVCPNCHAVIHAGGKCRTIEEVKAMLKS